MAAGPRDDTDARLEALLAKHGRLVRYAIWKVLPRSLGLSVEDIEQDARVRLWRALSRERDLTNPASYVYRAAVCATLDAVRRARAAREDRMGLLADMEQVRPAEGSAPRTPEDQAAGRELGDALERALGRVAADRQRAVRLHLQGFGSQEMADLLGWTEPRARNLTYRGLEDLRQELRAEGVVDAAG